MVAVTLFGYYYVAAGCDMDKEEAMEYDQLVRNKQWQEIIEKAEEKSPVSPFGVTCLNLALGKTGQMGDRMFEFYQNGTEGLLPEFQRDFTSPLPTSEAYYHLGMVNTAQRFTFEAMEAIPNFNKWPLLQASGRDEPDKRAIRSGDQVPAFVEEDNLLQGLGRGCHDLSV